MSIGYPKALQKLSDRLLGLSTEAVDAGIRESLAELGQMAGAGRVYVFLLSDDGKSLDRAFEWCDEGVVGHDFSSFRGVPVTAFPWSMDQFERGEAVYVRDASVLPEEAESERGACEALSIGAYVNVPLTLHGRLGGWLGFDSDEREPGWGADEIEMMRAAGRMLIFTIDRIERENALRTEQALSRRLTALGSFAAGLGHEVNNPLAYVSLNLQLLRRRLEERGDDKALGYLADCEHGVEQITQTVETLRAFSRAKSTNRIAVHIGRALDSTLRLLAPQIALRARLESSGETDAWVQASPSELGQVFANILQNAMDALPEGRAAEHHIRISTHREGGHVIIAFSDSGPGFTDEILPHVFEPFFTTRVSGGGSGIGLALCYRIVDSLGGTISAGNQPGGGALIRVSVPVVEPPLRATDWSEPPRSNRRRRVLVIDDVALLRRALRALLEAHEVHEAAGGSEAIALLERDPDWDVVICDLLMPEGTGQDVYDYLKKTNPALAERMVFTSGGPDNESSAGFLANIPNRVLYKPIDATALLDVVESCAPLGRRN